MVKKDMATQKTKVVILAAGYATRLWPLTLDRPKPLLPIGERPMLEHIMLKLKQLDGVGEVLVVTNTRFVRHFRRWEKSYKTDYKVSIVDDGMVDVEERRGSIGDLIFTVRKKRINTDILVVAGDNIFDFDIRDFVKTARLNAPYVTIGLFDIKDRKLARKYGIAALDADKVIVSFEEKPARPRSSLAAMCFYYIPKKRLASLRDYSGEGNSLDLAGSFIKWLSKREKVYGYVFDGRWMDIGDKGSLKMAQNINWQKNKQKNKGE